MSIFDKEQELPLSEVREIFVCRGSRVGCELGKKPHFTTSLKEIHFETEKYHKTTGSLHRRTYHGVCAERSIVTMGKKWLSSFIEKWR